MNNKSIHYIIKIMAVAIITVGAALFMFSCNHAIIREYTEKTEWDIKNYQAVTTPLSVSEAHLGQDIEIEHVNYTERKIIIKKEIIDNGVTDYVYGIADFDGNYLYPIEYDLIYYSFNAYVLLKGVSTTIINYGEDKSVHFDNGYANILYDNVIAFYPQQSYKIEIMTYDRQVLYNIFDNYRSENIINYGKYLIYENVEFSEYQVYNLGGEVVFSTHNAETNALYYLYMNRLLYVSYVISDINSAVINKMYDLSTGEEIGTYLHTVFAVSNAAMGNIVIGEGYSLIALESGHIYANGDFSDIKPAHNGAMIMSGGYTHYNDITEHTLIIYNSDLEIINELEDVYNPYQNGEIITLATLTLDGLKYGVIDVQGNELIPYSYDYISMVVDNIAIAYDKIDEDTYKYYRINIISGEVISLDYDVPQENAGLYYITTDNVLNVYNYNGDVIMTRVNHSIKSINVTYGNNAYIATIDTFNNLYFNVVNYN